MIVKLAPTAAVVAAAVALWAGTGHRGATPYKMVDDLVATDLSTWVGKEVIVHGWVEGGSIVDQWRKDRGVSFVLVRGGKRLRVVMTISKTRFVRDQFELAARGHLVRASDLEIVDAACAAGHDDADPRPVCRVPGDAEYPYVLVTSEINGYCPTKYDGNNLFRARHDAYDPPSFR
jgi:hypothetical protein